MAGKKKINYRHIAEVRKAYKEREEKRHEQSTPYENLASDFVSTVSHELRTPLAIIKEGISLVGDGDLGPITSEQHRALKLSLNSVNRLIRLVSELLDVSRLEKGKFKLHKRMFNFPGLTEEIFKSFENLAQRQGKNLSYEVTTDREELVLYADPDKLTQVLINIIQNALKHTKEGGSIKLGITDKAERAYLSVCDQGPGIPEEDLSLVFKKFHQVKRPGEGRESGLGLGLSIAGQIVEMHGGRIAVKSKPGQGTEFIIKLPLAIPFLASIIKLIRREKLTKGETKELRKYGMMKLLVETMEYSGLDIDEREELLEALQELKLHKGNLPSIWDHIEDFRKINLKDEKGRNLSAVDYKEAFLMAYIEKNMGEFKYRGKHIYKYGDTNRKRRALMSLVKELPAELLDQKLREIERSEYNVP